MKKTAVLCILTCGDQFLLLKRLREPNAGMFTPVGGKLDPHEDPTTAAYRETLEETGIEADNFQFCGVLVETAPADYNWTSFVYRAEIPFCEAPYCNEGTLQWIRKSELENIPTPATDWFIYQYVAEGKNFFFNAVYDDALNLQWMQEEVENTRVFNL